MFIRVELLYLVSYNSGRSRQKKRFDGFPILNLLFNKSLTINVSNNAGLMGCMDNGSNCNSPTRPADSAKSRIEARIAVNRLI